MLTCESLKLLTLIMNNGADSDFAVLRGFRDIRDPSLSEGGSTSFNSPQGITAGGRVPEASTHLSQKSHFRPSNQCGSITERPFPTVI